MQTLKAWQMDPYTLKAWRRCFVCCKSVDQAWRVARGPLPVVRCPWSVALLFRGKKALVESSREGRREQRNKRAQSVL